MTADNFSTAPNRSRAIVAPVDAVELLDSLATAINANAADAPEIPTGDTDSALPPASERFHITDRSGLEWYARKLANIRTERENIKAQAAKMIAALDSDEARLKHLYEAEAQATTAAILSNGGSRRKSVDTFFGTFGFRTVPGRYAVTDREAALPHAQALGCVKVEVTAEAYLQAAQAKLEETGELLPGVAKTEDVESFGLSLPTKRKKGGIITLEEIDE